MTEDQKALTAKLWHEDFESLMRMARAANPTLPEETLVDAVNDAVLYVGQSGQFTRYSRRASNVLRDVARKRIINGAESFRGAQSATGARAVPSEAEVFDGTVDDPFREALDAASFKGRLRELALRLSPRDAQFLVLTALGQLSRDEAAERMGVSHDTARRLTTSTTKHLRRFYASIESGAIHDEFAGLVAELRVQGLSMDEVLEDGQVLAHLKWCETCGDLVRSADRELQALAPLLPALGALAKSGILASIFGGGAAAVGGGSGAAFSSGSTVVAGCLAVCTVGGAVYVAADAPETATAKKDPSAQTETVVQGTALPAPTPNFTVPAGDRTEPRVRPVASSTPGTKSKNKNSSRRKKKRARSASSRDVETLAGTASARGAAGSRSTAPTSSNKQVESSYGLGGGGAAPASAPKPKPKVAPAPAPATRQGCTPGDLGC